MWFFNKKKDILPKEEISKLCAFIINSLQTEPEKWEFDRHEARLKRNGKEIEIWTSNEDYGLKIQKPVWYVPTSYERKKIWEAYKIARDNFYVDFMKKYFKEFEKKISKR